MQPKISIIIPVTRQERLNKLFSLLDGLICDRSKTELIFYVDTDILEVANKCSKYIENTLFTRAIVEVSGNAAPSEIRIAKRRDRIVEAHNNIKKLISDDSEYVCGFEDDTHFPDNAIVEMIPIIQRGDIGFVEGV